MGFVVGSPWYRAYGLRARYIRLLPECSIDAVLLVQILSCLTSLLVEVDLPLAGTPFRRFGYVDLNGSASQNHCAFEKIMVRSFKAGEALQEAFQTEEDGEGEEVRPAPGQKNIFLSTRCLHWRLRGGLGFVSD